MIVWVQLIMAWITVTFSNRYLLGNPYDTLKYKQSEILYIYEFQFQFTPFKKSVRKKKHT